MKSFATTEPHITANRFWGTTALVSGTTIGAGVLALPSVTIGAGVIPSSIALVLVWVYALSTGLLLAEIHLRTLEQQQTLEAESSMGLIRLITPVLGSRPIGQILRAIAAVAYGFLHYALLVAYIAQGGALLTPWIKTTAEVILVLDQVPVPSELGPIAFVCGLGGLLYWGRSQVVDRVNASFVGMLLIAFLGLMIEKVPQISSDRLWLQNWAMVPAAVPVMLVAIFFQNVVPVVTTQLEGNIQQIRRSLIWGSALPLGLYLLWNTTVLLSVKDSLSSSTLLPSSLWISIFSVFAIATSFIGFVYGLMSFYNDIFLIKMTDVEKNPNLKRSLYLLVLTPAIVIAILNPNVFLSALNWAGTLSISILGGVLPAWMAWQQRQVFQEVSQVPALVPGGKWSLGAIGAIGLMILCRIGS